MGAVESVTSYFTSTQRPTKRRQSTRGSPKKRKTDSGSIPVPDDKTQVTSINPIRMDSTSALLAGAYEKVFYEYADEGKILDTIKLKEITKSICSISENATQTILELLNQVIRLHDLLVQNNYVKSVISIIAEISTLKVFDLYEKQLTVPRNLPVSEYSKFVDKVIELRKTHSTYSNNLQLFQDDLESKKNQILPNIKTFSNIIESKRNGNSIVDHSDIANYESMIYRLKVTINNEKNKNKADIRDETEFIIKTMFNSLNESDLDLIKRMKTSIKCINVNNSEIELSGLQYFLTSVENILKRLKSSKECFESVDKIYCKKIYNIIEIMIDPIIKENKKSHDELIKERKKLDNYNNELNILYLKMENEKSSKTIELENKKKNSELNIEKMECSKNECKNKLNEILLYFNQYEEMLKSIISINKSSLRKKIENLNVNPFEDEYNQLVKLLF